MRHAAELALLIAGTACVVLAALGTAAIADVHDRLHFAAPATLGALLIAAAIVVRESISLIGIAALLLAAFLVGIGPLTTHAIGRLARTLQRGDWRPESRR